MKFEKKPPKAQPPLGGKRSEALGRLRSRLSSIRMLLTAALRRVE
jgi:hypothetical protein